MKKNDYHSRKGQGFLSNFAEINIFPTTNSFISQSFFFFYTVYDGGLTGSNVLKR